STTETAQVIEFKIKDIPSIKEFVNKGVNTELPNEESIEKRIESHRILNKENVISNKEISNESSNIEKSVSLRSSMKSLNEENIIDSNRSPVTPLHEIPYSEIHDEKFLESSVELLDDMLYKDDDA